LRTDKVATGSCAEDVSYLVPDRVTGLQEVEELRLLCPGRVWNFVNTVLCLHVMDVNFYGGMHRLKSIYHMMSVSTAPTNVSRLTIPVEQESQAARPVIEALMWPRRTVMDFVRVFIRYVVQESLTETQSLAMALYFASRGRGQLECTQNANYTLEYSSPARVILSGLGSDELLGGYGRHRTAFQTGGWRAVIDEVGHYNVFDFGHY
jgi:hypothetical protein